MQTWSATRWMAPGILRLSDVVQLEFEGGCLAWKDPFFLLPLAETGLLESLQTVIKLNKKWALYCDVNELFITSSWELTVLLYLVIGFLI